MLDERLTLLTAVRLEFGLLRGDVEALEKWPDNTKQSLDWPAVSRHIRSWLQQNRKPPGDAQPEAPKPAALKPESPNAAPPTQKPPKKAHARLAAVLLNRHPALCTKLKGGPEDLPTLLTTLSNDARVIRALASFLQLASEVLPRKKEPVPAKKEANE
ncbi:MAG TPA: hypothetical protein PLA94_29100, partial [Myxococcota bacterium]|nr:hypothetical protein [Myxococcota bacterium]